MNLCEKYGALRITDSGKIVFVLDASESAETHQQEIIVTVQQVLSELPAGVERRLYFLGNSSAYALNRFASQAAEWFRDNRKRPSLITPMWDTLDKDDAAAVVIIGSGNIYDLEDWAGHPLRRRMILVSMNESLQGQQRLAEEMMRPTVQELRQRLYDPVICVEISGPGFMPILWDNSGCRLTISPEKVSLVGARLENYSIRLQFFTAEDDRGAAMPVQTVMHLSGRQTTEPLDPIEPTTLIESEVGQFSAEEVEIFRKAVNREAFFCIHCGREHPWNTLLCLQGAAILGESVYPSLQQSNATGFVVLQARENSVCFKTHPGGVLRLDAGKVAIKEEQQAPVYSFDGQAARWVRAQEVLKPYHPIGKDAYAILL